MINAHSRKHDARKHSGGWLSILGGALFAMGCATGLPKDNPIGAILFAAGAGLLGAFIVKSLGS